MAQLTLDVATACRLAIVKQRLAGVRPAPTIDGALEIARDLRCIQLDPTNVVARTQYLVLWSRLGSYDRQILDDLQWAEKWLFHYWAHAASLVLTEDYPLHRVRMEQWRKGDTSWGRRAKQWMRDNAALQRHILRELRTRGPLRSRDIEDKSSVPWASTGWTAGRNVGRMLDFLWARGTITVAGRAGSDRIWDLSDRWFPEWTPSDRLTHRAMVERAAQISLRCLGVATAKQIRRHFIRDEYVGLENVLRRLVDRGDVLPVSLRRDGIRSKATWYVHAEDLDLAERLRSTEWEDRTTLLSPFDNLICDRDRTEELFDFSYRIEIYVPKNKRRFGYFVMPILHRDRLIGRIDAAANGDALTIKSVHMEPTAPTGEMTRRAVVEVLEDLSSFVKARTIRWSDDSATPSWRRFA